MARQSTARVPASDRNVTPKDNAPATLTLHDELVEMGRQLREHEIAVDTGKAAAMERFARAAAAAEFDVDSGFAPLFLAWRYPAPVPIKVDRKHAGEMTRFLNACKSAVAMKRLNVDFTDTITTVRQQVEALRAVGGKDAPKVRQMDQAIAAVASWQKDNPNTPITPAVIKQRIVVPVNVPTIDDLIKKATSDIDAFMNVDNMAELGFTLPRDWLLKLNQMKSDIGSLKLVAEPVAAE